MDGCTTRRARLVRMPALVAALAIVISSAAVPSAALAADPSPAGDAAAAVEATPLASLSAGEAMCASVGDLRTIVGFIQATDVEVDGWVPLLVGALAGLSEARALVGLTGEAYRPLVDELVASLQDVLSITDELRALDTLGSKVAAVGEAITEIGNDMDALSVALQEPCPATT